MPGSITLASPTTTTAKLAGRMYFLRDALHVGGGDRLDVLHVLREVIVRQVIDEHVLEPPRDVAGGFEAAREAQRDVVLRARQFVGRHRLAESPFSSLKNSFSASAVLSVCTPAAAKNGPADARMSNAELAP